MKGASDYTENELIEQPAIELFKRLGWQHLCAYEESYASGGMLGRDNRSEVVLVSRLRPALQRINHRFVPAEAIDQAIEAIIRDRSSLSSVQANREIYELLKNGFKAEVRDSSGETVIETVKIINWDDPDKNDFLLVNQFWVTGDMYTRRPDMVAFVNGIPLALFEFKKPSENIKHAFGDNLRDYKDTIPQFFWYNAFIILSNGTDSRIGTISSEWEHFSEWKKINDEDEEGGVSLETVIRGTCNPEKFMDIIENFLLYTEIFGGLTKLIAKNHQYLGVNAAIAAVKEYARARDTQVPLTQTLSQRERDTHYRAGFDYSGLVKRARELRRQQTPAEEILWELLRNRQLMGAKFWRQHQIGDYIADFYCHEARLVVEVDGSVHRTQDKQSKDSTRTKYLESLGFCVVRVSNEAILTNTEKALQTIADRLPSHFGRGAGGEGKTHTAAAGCLGVFWHTQGSGKSYSMIFFSQKILRKLPGNWSFVVVTDRLELDDQIYKNFANAGVLTEGKDRCHAESAEHLKQLLGEDHRCIFTLIHKFHTETGEQYPKISDRDDIIVMTDEAHRTQYDVLAMNMRNALPNAAFIGFTGTPLIAGEERTREVFGDYVSIYDFKQSVDDNATVPLFYENRIPELELINENLDDDLERLLEDAALNEAEEQKLEREFSREYHLITRDDRLDAVAADIVEHFINRGYPGKAMVICIDKLTAVRMYDKVKAHWDRELQALKDKLRTPQPEGFDPILDKLNYMKETDMAVVVSSSQNEMALFKEKGLDIASHRKRMNKEDLETKFKNSEDPLRMVFLCAMWTTGFDVPCCSTIYLDKPMKNHTLMQTIARANRVFGEKVSGLIVDYVGIFRNLQQALAIYGAGTGGDMPVRNKQELVNILRKAIKQMKKFLQGIGVDLLAMLKAKDFKLVGFMRDAVDAILADEETKKTFVSDAGYIDRLFKAILPDPKAKDFAQTRKLLEELVKMIRETGEPVDISKVVSDIEQLLDESIGPVEKIKEKPDKLIDLSQIDFDALQEKFRKGRKRIEIERLRAAIGKCLETMMLRNKSRIELYRKFQDMIADYNAGSKNVEELFRELIEFAQTLDEEEKRHIREGLSEEELTLFDILTKPDPNLTKKQEAEVKKVARELLEKLQQEKLVLDWRKKQQTRAAVKLCIEETLDLLPEAFTRKVYLEKCERVYQHIYDSYFGAGKSVYAMAS